MRMRHFAAALSVLFLLAACGDDDIDPVSPDEGPAPPEWIHVSATAAGRITLRWVDATTDESGFAVERSTSEAGDFEEIARTAPDAWEYADATVAAGEVYYYRVRTRDSIGRLSAAAAPVRGRAVDNAAPAVPSAPFPADKASNLAPQGALTLTWQTSDADGPAPACDLYFGEARNALQPMARSLAEYSHALPDTLAWTRYFFWRVVAMDEHGATALSPIWSFGTRIETVTVPEGPFYRGDCGRFWPADTLHYCAPSNPVLVPAFDIDKLEVSNQRFSQFLTELLQSRWIRLIDGQARSSVGDTLFASIYPDGDEHSGIEFAAAGGGFFTPRPGRENHPVVEVTWHGARRFAARYGRRLPTEAEWEKAARGTSGELGYFRFDNAGEPDSVGIGFPFPWGSELHPSYFNYLGSGDPFETTVGVGTAPSGFFDGAVRGGFTTRSNASPYGILDLAGNVSEWCLDTFVAYHGGASPNLKVVRGGGWRSQPHWCQTFWRAGLPPGLTDNQVGFRTAASQ